MLICLFSFLICHSSPVGGRRGRRSPHDHRPHTDPSPWQWSQQSLKWLKWRRGWGLKKKETLPWRWKMCKWRMKKKFKKTLFKMKKKKSQNYHHSENNCMQDRVWVRLWTSLSFFWTLKLMFVSCGPGLIIFCFWLNYLFKKNTYIPFPKTCFFFYCLNLFVSNKFLRGHLLFAAT